MSSEAALSFITPEMAEKVLKILETGASSLHQEAGVFLSEVINYLIFAEAMNVLQMTFWLFIVAPLLFKVFNVWVKKQEREVARQTELYEAEKKQYEKVDNLYRAAPSTCRLDDAKIECLGVKAIRGFVLGFCLFISISFSLNSITSLGKIVFAPKLYLLQIVAKTVKGPAVTK